MSHVQQVLCLFLRSTVGLTDVSDVIVQSHDVALVQVKLDRLRHVYEEAANATDDVHTKRNGHQVIGVVGDVQQDHGR